MEPSPDKQYLTPEILPLKTQVMAYTLRFVTIPLEKVAIEPHILQPDEALIPTYVPLFRLKEGKA
jgi:hypothetical protein